METKLEAIHQRLTSIDKTLAVNTQELSHHIEQTMILREEVKQQRADLDVVKIDYAKFKGFFLYLGWTIAVIGGIVTIVTKVYTLR